MCQQTEIGLKIEQLCRQGMPRKVGKRMENTFLKKMNSASSEQSQNIETSDMKKNLDIPVFDADFLRRHLSLKLGPNFDKSGKGGDILAVGTQWTRKFAQIIAVAVNLITKSNAYKTLSRTTQPAHVIAIGILTFVLFAVWPSLLETKDTSNTDRKSGLALVAYLGAFATHFGTQIWMTFVSGLSLYFALPRHTFGQCQQILFPKYFAMNSILSICTLILFIKAIGGRWEFASYVQVIALTLCAVIEVAVRLYLAPPLLRLMSEKHKFEISFGSGQEIGHLDQKDLVKCPHYQKIHKSFRRIHMTVATGNLTTLLCTFMHLHYLASRISVS